MTFWLARIVHKADPRTIFKKSFSHPQFHEKINFFLQLGLLKELPCREIAVAGNFIKVLAPFVISFVHR